VNGISLVLPLQPEHNPRQVAVLLMIVYGCSLKQGSGCQRNLTVSCYLSQDSDG
jgi:hypothetical protein